MDCKVVQITTPKGVLLDGLWFGPTNPKRTYILIHGLGSDVFSCRDFILPLLDSQTAALFFNNRGHAGITRISKIDKRKKHGTKSILGGMSHEVFTDSPDDIQGAINVAKKFGPQNIVLVGHSTGAQKAVYYLATKKDSIVNGAVLLSPLSDYAGMRKQTDPVVYTKALQAAQELVRNKTPHALLPLDLWPYPLDAQRFVSLYTPESKEEIFTYASKRKPVTLKRVTVPLLVVLGGKDEYRDRPMKQIAKWFEKALKKQTAQIEVIPNTGHSFHEAEEKLQKVITRWLMQKEKFA